MSVQGTILVLDGVSTNRIMLKVQLTAAWYHVVQGDKLKGLTGLLRRARPDLVLTALTLPDGTAADVKNLMMNDPALADVPVVAIAPQNDKAARLRALADGLDDVLAHPFKDTLLLARVRSFLRARADTQDLQVKSGPQSMGFAESAAASFAPPAVARVALLTRNAHTSANWRKALADHQTRHDLSSHTLSNLQGVLSGPVPDAIVIELDASPSSLNILADLRSRSGTRHTVLIGVLADNDATRAAEALDRGADAVCLGGFCSHETLLRLNSQIARKSRIDRMRASLRKGLADSWIDPLTGLHNRRYAMRAMDQIARQSVQTGHEFAIMLADLDHFKAINDKFGHSAGDQVLTDAAIRMRSTIGPAGFVARIGGEEFMIGIPDTTRQQAMQMANVICDSICDKPFHLRDQGVTIPVTISVGLNVSDPSLQSRLWEADPVDKLIQAADKALYAAKNAGRNQVRFRQSAA